MDDVSDRLLWRLRDGIAVSAFTKRRIVEHYRTWPNC
jgi:hypothetical protein